MADFAPGINPGSENAAAIGPPLKLDISRANSSRCLRPCQGGATGRTIPSVRPDESPGKTRKNPVAQLPDRCDTGRFIQRSCGISLDSWSGWRCDWARRGEPIACPGRAVLLLSVLSLPIFWLLGLTLAHRFNRPHLRALPFLANLLPVLGLFWFGCLLAQEEGGEFFWTASYLGILLLLLAVGALASHFSA